MKATAMDIKRQEATALLRLFESRDIVQSAFGKAHHLGTASMVWQYIHGHRPLNLSAAVKFAAGLQVPIDTFSPRLASEISTAYAHTAHAQFKPGARKGVAVAVAKPPATYSWPFRRVDAGKVHALSRDDLLRLEGALLAVAVSIQIDISHRRAA